MTGPDIATKLRVKSKEKTVPPWEVVVYNDPVNLMNYVALVFRRVFGYPEVKCRELMMRVHSRGEAIVWTGQRERAEYYVQQLQAHQLQSGLRGGGGRE